MSKSTGTSLNIGVGAISRAAGRGNVHASIHNIFKGRNWTGSKPFVEQPLDRTGYIFIARTDMNLHRDNIKGHRQFESLLSTNRLSAGQAIRSLLDPRSSRDGKCSPLINEFYGFNTLLENTVTSCSGWPNTVNNVTPTAPNEKGASNLLIEGKYKSGIPFSLSIEHINTEGDMVSQMYAILSRYPTLLRHGEVEMYADNIVLDRVDWKSRIYRFVLDKNGHRVEQFTMTGEAFPVSDSTGSAMNFSTESPHNEGYDTVSAEWQCGGFYHNDPIVIDEFNRTQIMHNPNMADGIRENFYYRVGTDENLPSLAIVEMYQYLGYPRINPLTLEFEVWIQLPLHELIKEYSNVAEFIEAMSDKNDNDIRVGNEQYDQDAFKDVIGWSYDELPSSSGTETA